MNGDGAGRKVTWPKAVSAMTLLLCSSLVLVMSLIAGKAERADQSVGPAGRGDQRLSRTFKKEKFPPCKTEVMSDEVFVKLNKSIPADTIQILFKQLAQDRAFRFEEVGTGQTLYLVHIDGFKVSDLLVFFTSLNSQKQKFRVMADYDLEVEYAQPNFVLYKEDAPNDPEFGNQWGLRDSGGGKGGISAVSAWRTSTGLNRIVVGVVDTGVAYRHPDLDDNMWSAPWDFTVHVGGADVTCHKGDHGFNEPDKNCDPAEFEYHGTRVSGILGAEGNNNQGVAGVNWTTSIMGLKWISQSGNTNEMHIVNAIDFAVEVKKQAGLADIRVLNNSYGYLTTPEAVCMPSPIAEAVRRANDAGILFVASAGEDHSNNNDVNPHYPSGLDIPNVISVAATTKSDKLFSISNWGMRTVHLGAPGASIASTQPSTGYSSGSGTSYAAPFVSGAAALILSKCPTLTTAAVKACILNNADRIPGLASRLPEGRRLNVNKAMSDCGRCVP